MKNKIKKPHTPFSYLDTKFLIGIIKVRWDNYCSGAEDKKFYLNIYIEKELMTEKRLYYYGAY